MITFETLNNRMINGAGEIQTSKVTRTDANTLNLANYDASNFLRVGTKMQIEFASTGILYGYVQTKPSSGAFDVLVATPAGANTTLPNEAITVCYFGNTNALMLHPDFIDIATGGETGWTSFTSRKYLFACHGALGIFMFRVDGTSNSTTTSLTLPIPASSEIAFQGAGWWEGRDNNVLQTNNGRMFVDTSSPSTLSFNLTFGTTAWTNSGRKVVSGTFLYYLEQG